MMRSSTQRIATLAARTVRARSMSTAAMPEQRLFNAMPLQIPKFPAMPKQEPAFKAMPMQARPMPPQEPFTQASAAPAAAASSGGMGAAPIIAVAVVGGGVAYAYTQGMIPM
eukprot:CAMPEP_0119010504 /NCGR_PEP_ID=MMETSP1176-20130426/5060_1 /TAXON_ID=265551 /ORGANISM="Synedropsis recta cf, Strain CCMP1620" /LENGTH=111 /DNA_ID=CAMNT_0006963177 /DNA_START=38 /DNA_END=373 /DNA_ORIENTATION=-